jgi:hypothetical protein
MTPIVLEWHVNNLMLHVVIPDFVMLRGESATDPAGCDTSKFE